MTAALVDYCPQCGARIVPDDDEAAVCISCGGQNRRLWPPHACQRCGQAIGYVGRLIEAVIGDTHRCIVPRRGH